MLLHSAAYFAVRAANGLFALGLLALLTRLLAPQQYGIYAMSMAVVSVTAAICFQWLGSAAVRFYMARGITASALLSILHSLFYRVAVVIALVTALFAVIRPLADASSILLLLVGASSIGMGLHDLHLQIATARRQPWRYGLISASRGAALLLLAAALAYKGFGVEGVLAAVFLSSLLATLLFGSRWSGTRGESPQALPRELALYGVPVALASGMTMVFSFADRFLIGWWHGSQAVAGYAAAYDLAQQTVGVALNVFFMASYPKAAAAWESGGAAEARSAIAGLRRALFLVAPLAVGLFIGLADEIAALIFGAGISRDAATVIPVIALAIGIGCAKSFLLDLAFLLTKSTPILLRIATVMAVLNIVLNALVVPQFGPGGAAFVALATFLTGAALSWWFGRAAGLYPRLDIEALKAGVCLVSLLTVTWLAESTELVKGIQGDLWKTTSLAALGVAAFAIAAWLIDLSQLRSGMICRRESPLDTTL